MSKLYYFIKSMILICILFLVLTLTVFASEAAATIKVIPNAINNEVVVSVEYNGSNMCGGSFNFVYDTTALRLVSVEEGETIKNTSHFINPDFADDTIRINWVSTIEMPTEGKLINIKFEMLDGFFKKSDVGIEKLKIADSNGNKQEAEYIICYEESGQIDSPTEGENGNNTSKDEFGDNTGINQGTENNNNTSGNNSYTSIKPFFGNSAAKQETENNKSVTAIEFIDVRESDWFFTSVKYVVENKLMNGISKNEFAPNDTLTRAMLVTVLYRNAGEPVVNKSIPFADVDMDSWYANAVVWAKQNGIVNGVNDTDFAPNANITREQIATIMFRYAQFKNTDTAVALKENLHFTDADEISEYALSAMNWAVGTGLINGKTSTTLNPKDSATRAEIATILKRFTENNKY